MLFWSSAALPLPVLCSWCLLSCCHSCPTSAAAAALTAMHESLVYATSKTDIFCLAPCPHSHHIPKNTCKYLETPMSCSRLPGFCGFLFFLASEEDWDAQDTQCLIGFVGSRATKGLLWPGPCSLSLPPSLSSLSWIFSFLLYLAAGVNTLFCDCIMIYVTFSVERLMLQIESGVTPVILLNRRTGHFEHSQVSIRTTTLQSFLRQIPVPLYQHFWSVLPHAVHQQSVWLMAGLLAGNMGLLLWLLGPNLSICALIVIAPKWLHSQPGQLSGFVEWDFIGICNYSQHKLQIIRERISC